MAASPSRSSAATGQWGIVRQSPFDKGTPVELRVRVRVLLPPGWELLDPEIELQEYDLEHFGRAVEASYSLWSDATGVSLRAVQVPASVRGVYLPSSELSASGHRRLYGSWRGVFNVGQFQSRTVGARGYDSELLAGGVRYLDQSGRRVEARLNYREGRSETTVFRRSVTMSAGTPAGPLYHGPLE
jgi:hypothetical protein